MRDLEKWNRPLSLIAFVALPQSMAAVAVILLARGGAIALIPPVAALTGLLCIGALAAGGYAIARRHDSAVPQPLLLILLAQTACAFAPLILLIYPMPQPTQFIGIEAILLLLAAVCATGLCALLLSGRVPLDAMKIKGALGYGLLLPLACALGASLWSSVNRPTDVALSVACALLCLCAACFFGYVRSFFEKESPAQALDALPARPKRFYQRTWFVALFAIVLPVTGLGLANSLNFLGFDSPWFYVIAVANGVLMLPALNAKRQTLPLFYLKAVGFGYITYFALVFLPFTLLGLIGLLIALGVLLLTPAVVFATQLGQLRAAYKSLRPRCAKALLWALLAGGMLTLPAILGIDAAIDRANYVAALAGVDQGAPAPRVDTARLARTLNNMNTVNARFNADFDAFTARGFNLFAPGTPILSGAYSAIVYGGQPIGQTRARQLFTAYFHRSPITPDMSSWHITQPGFALLAHREKTRYDEQSGVYRTWVELELKNTAGTGNREYKTTFDLAPGNFITGYSLYVGRDNKRGLLSERLSAQMVYDSIVTARRDPGLLTYLDEDTLSLSVFPFAAGEVRTTGFEIMHIAPVEIAIEGQIIPLDAPGAAHSPIDLGVHRACGQDCRAVLPYTGDAYDDALILRHNCAADPGNMARVGDAIAQHVLTPNTAFIVLETAQQEAALRALQERIMNNEPLPERFLSMDEPNLMWPLLAALALIALKRRKRAPARPA